MAAKDQADLNHDHADHALGTGVGAASGAAAGAAIGLAGGPAGAAVGAVIGAIAGGLAGVGVAEMSDIVDHDAENVYWRDAHSAEPYFRPGMTYEDYQPAYRMGWSSPARYDGGTFDQYEPAFRNDWDSMKGVSRLSWDDARHAARAGWHRVERALPGDADGDGR